MTSPPSPQSPQPLSDSPLFWLLLFGGTALVAIVLIEPKFAKREERLERMYHARQRVAAQAQNGQPGQGGAAPDRQVENLAPPVASQAPMVSLRSLGLALACVLLAAAFALALLRRHRPSEPGT